MDERVRSTAAIATACLLVGAALGVGGAGLINFGSSDDTAYPNEWTANPTMETFASNESFAAYFRAADRSNLYFGPSIRTTTRPMMEDVAMGAPVAADGEAGGGAGGPDRVSDTNVQVESLDEPDLLKTDGNTSYYAGHRFQYRDGETSIFSLEDPSSPELVATIPAAGELALIESSGTLVVLGDDRIWGYDVSDPANPTQLWDERIDADLQTARLDGETLYLVLVDRPDHAAPCPIRPLSSTTIPCTEIYRPSSKADADAVYTAVRMDTASGSIDDEVSVVGSYRDSATYVSENAIYLSYTRSMSRYDLLTAYLTGPGASQLDESTRERINNLQNLDISERAKSVELDVIIESWYDSMDEDERREAADTFQEGLTEYAEDNQREMTRTGITRIDIDGPLEVTDSGEVPGVPLNQWSMDEHEDHLRIATTIPGSHGATSKNDVYVLDSSLEITGSITGLGETERIYAVRFEGDEGHVVTFRQIDPFYTLDLSDPTNPTLEGELKIPGFSSYLHPLDDDLMLGVGEQDRQVKVSLFDVSDRSDPTELDAEILDREYYSEVNQNHRAFLHDERHEAVFIPGSEDSYVFSYANGSLEEVISVDIGGHGVRAMYIDDYLYVYGEGEVVVIDETTWAVETRIDAR
ncbi:MAG: beta-propeller domain-containing protein [Natrialbaceae archaeon]|nr:beta-propeller domain-containing protein [Natrialbaceae archaeon]